MKLITDMRRSEKAITNVDEIEKILKESLVGYMALSKDNLPYVIPVNFLYLNGRIYIHCALEGKKLQYIKKNPNVCFLVNKPATGPRTTCGAAVNYHSVMAFGKAKFTRNPDIDSLKKLGEKYHECSEYGHEKFKGTGMIEIRIEEVSAKRGYSNTVNR